MGTYIIVVTFCTHNLLKCRGGKNSINSFQQSTAQIIPCLSYCLAEIMVISMRSTRVNNFFKKEPNLSFVAAKLKQNCTGTGNYNSKATRQGIICAQNQR